MSEMGLPWARLEGFRSSSPPQRCPFCLQDARVREEEPPAGIVVVTGCPCTAHGPLRMSEALARQRWREMEAP